MAKLADDEIQSLLLPKLLAAIESRKPDLQVLLPFYRQLIKSLISLIINKVLLIQSFSIKGSSISECNSIFARGGRIRNNSKGESITEAARALAHESVKRSQ